jgi:UPF0271 protein
MSLHATHIDLNSDVGEFPAALADGSEDRLLRLVSSANIACGGHAGDASSIRAVVGLCLLHDVSVGAHPAYPDRAGFGRTRIEISESDLKTSVREQVERLMLVAGGLGATVRHVKPHGALYNAAARNAELAAIIADAVSGLDRRLVLVGLAGSVMLKVWKSAGFTTVGEAFADRRYEPDGTLRARTLPDALIIDPVEAARQALSIARDGVISATDGSRLRVDAQTICIHGDTVNATAIASEVRNHLQQAGISVAPF